MEYIEIEIVESEQKEYIKKIIDLGSVEKCHPIKFAMALAKSFQIICEVNGIELEQILVHLKDFESDSNLH